MKKKICFFLRKPFYGKNFSIENFYYEIFSHNSNDFVYEFKVCPFESRGFLRRLFLSIWAIFNQGDINHICGDINFISIFLNKKKTINTILDTYSMRRLKGLKKYLYKIFWIKIPLFKSSNVIAISNKTRKEIRKYSDYKKNISVIDMCTQKIFKKKIKKKINKVPKILIVGTSENKNIKNVFYSLKNIKCELIVIGNLMPDQIDILKNFKIKFKCFISLNNKSLVQKFFQSDLLVFASNYEGFGIPILEAQTVGRAVLTSKLEPMTYVGGNGALYVNPENIKSITNGINNLIKNSKLRNSLIKRGFANIKRFNKINILQQHINLYNKILYSKLNQQVINIKK
tara:strand:+ start:50 stop:1078 length:1029 start_codon:yes stop_codon:yes gene_type:complete